MSETPKNLGFKIPAEWEKHSAVWLAWPHDKISFGSLNETQNEMDEERLSRVEQKFLEIIKAISESEIVKLLVLNGEVEERVKKMLRLINVNLDRINFYEVDYADVWLRDFGPIFISNGREKAWLKWVYDAYGNKFPDLLKDNNVFLKLEKVIGKRMFKIDFILEGGSIEINGDGICLTTEKCLIEKSRNNSASKEKVEQVLKDNLGVEKIIWLKDGLVNDHTDGHIDDIARFIKKDTILCAYEENTNDPNFKILEKNFRILENSTDQNNKKFNLVKIPMPHMNYHNGEKAPVSYVNFYVGNNVVLVPTFNDPNDERALDIIGHHFPDRKIMGVDCRDIIYGGGSIHCITQQEPL